MNCKPGDLAQLKGLVVNTELNGRFLEVLSFACKGKGVSVTSPDGKTRWTSVKEGAHWFCKSNEPIFHSKNGTALEIGLVADSNLRPIRDPGDDAQDETLSWLPMPSREGVEA